MNGTPSFPTTGSGHKQLQKTGAVTKRDCSRYVFMQLFQQDKSVFVGTDTVYEQHILVQTAGTADEACFFVRLCGFDANAGGIVRMAVPKADGCLLFIGFA